MRYTIEASFIKTKPWLSFVLNDERREKRNFRIPPKLIFTSTLLPALDKSTFFLQKYKGIMRANKEQFY